MLQTINHKWALSIGALLAFPATYFIFISFLKYGLGLPYMFDSTLPLLERLGIKGSIGWNINLLILFGPLIAMALNLFAVIKLEWHNERKIFSFKVLLEKHWWNITFVILSIVLLATLFIYAFGENCRC